MIPAVFRNARYEARLNLAEQRIMACAEMLNAQAEALAALTFMVRSMAEPDIRMAKTERAFGKGH